MPNSSDVRNVSARRGHPRIVRGLRGFADVARCAVLTTTVVVLVFGMVEGAVRFGFTFALLVAFRFARLPASLDAAVSVTLPLAIAASVFGWYREFVWMDWVVHFVNTGALAAATYLLLIRTNLLQRPRRNLVPHIMLQVTMVGTTLGVLWEFYEWFVKTVVHADVLVGYDDTIADLAMDMTGAMVAGVLVAILRREALA